MKSSDMAIHGNLVISYHSGMIAMEGEGDWDVKEIHTRYLY